MTKKREVEVFEREPFEHYIEPRWCSELLFKAEHFEGPLHDPCCGWGRIPEAARAAGYDMSGSDIIDRGFPSVTVEDFLECGRRRQNIAFNPPFDKFEHFVVHAIRIARRKVCVLMHTSKLTAAHWMLKEGLQHVWYLTPRPSMPPGYVAEELLIGTAGSNRSPEPMGGTKDFCWTVFEADKKRRAMPTVGWLHRDRGVLR